MSPKRWFTWAQSQFTQRFRQSETPSQSKTGQDGDMWVRFDKLMGGLMNVLAGIGIIFAALAALLFYWSR